jgi:nitrogen fixation/metabolism regulation signal transduction histidine kinase
VERRPEDAPATGFGLVGDTVREERYLQVLHPVPGVLARNADEVQRAYQEYQEKALGRTGLRKMYIGTLTLTLFLAVFIAVMLALLLGGQLARPLLMLLQGTKEVAEGDLSPKRELKSRDELGMLTQQFNQMTRQLAEARIAVEENRSALEQSKAYLESVLQNLTAGVLVFDRRFVLITTNPGAERIFRQPFNGVLGQPGGTDPRHERLRGDRASGIFRADHQRGPGRRAALAEADRVAAGRRGAAAHTAGSRRASSWRQP